MLLALAVLSVQAQAVDTHQPWIRRECEAVWGLNAAKQQSQTAGKVLAQSALQWLDVHLEETVNAAIKTADIILIWFIYILYIPGFERPFRWHTAEDAGCSKPTCAQFISASVITCPQS